MSITKNDEEVKITSGNNFKVYYNSAWITLGNIVSGKLSRSSDRKEIKYANGYRFDKRSSSKCTLTVVLAQVSKEILDSIDNILAAGRRLYFYNGLNNAYNMELYFPEANLIENFELTMSGDEHQTISLEFSVVPQSTNASVVPNTDLPTDRYATGGGTVSGTNPHYVVLETAA